jgi:electron transfer flavoprotein beta subunit
VKLVVCLHAPPPAPEGHIDLGRHDAHALALGLSLAEKEGAHRVTALLAGVAAEAGPLHRALSAGAHRAVRLTGDDYASADFHTLGQALAGGIKRLGADLVLTGARSDDEGLGAVPAALARQLGYPCVTGVEELADAGGTAVEAVVRGGGRKRRLRIELPAVLSVSAGRRALPPPPDRTGKPNDIEVLSLSDPEATVVRRRTELLGKPEPASRGTEEVTSAAALIAALTRR